MPYIHMQARFGYGLFPRPQQGERRKTPRP